MKVTKNGGPVTHWEDLRVEPTIKAAGANDPTFTKYFDNGAGSRGVYAFAMTNAIEASEKELYFQVQMPHNWKEGSEIHPHIHWLPITAGSAGEKVRWGMEYTKANIGSAIGNTTITYAETAAVGVITTAGSHSLTALPAITMTGDTISVVIMCRVFRNSSHVNDTYTGTAGILYIDFHYEVDSEGSEQEFVK